ncbi:MAG: hypothetical protein FWD11_07650, partial [Micrococcales bacterium]|nr:hypothetical protein [Micrococcales bacterium]
MVRSATLRDTSRPTLLGVLVIVMVALVALLSGCDPVSTWEDTQDGRPSQPKTDERTDSQPGGDNVLVGSWADGSSAPDPWNTSLGGPGGAGHGERLDFNADGTYAYIFVGTSSVVDFAIGDRGRYRVDGDKVTFYDRYHGYQNNKNPADSYDFRRADDGTAFFRIETDANGQKILTVFGVDGSGNSETIYGPLRYQ